MKLPTHPTAPEEIMAFLDGELSEAEAQVVSSHIAHCTDCSRLAEEFRGTSGALSRWSIPSVSAKLDNAVADAVEKTFPSHGAREVDEGRSLRPWIIGLASLAALALLFSVATPNLLRSRMAANEASAVGSLRTLNTALSTYSTDYGHYPPALSNLGPPVSGGPANEEAADLIDPVLAGGHKSGYVFAYQALPPLGAGLRGSYTINASPSEPGNTGGRVFSTDESGVLRASGAGIAGYITLGESRGSADEPTKERGEVQPDFEAQPMIARSAELKLVVRKLEDARQQMGQILKQHEGYVGRLSVSAETGSAPSLLATLHVPSDRLDSCLEELLKIGRVTQESVQGEEVTKQHRDLSARIKNSRNTEARLNEVLQRNRGQTKDVLEVERESARVRGEIEQMEAERKSLEHHVEFAAINLNLVEEYRAQIAVPETSAGTRLHNAFVAGLRHASETLLGIVLFTAEYGLTLLLWFVLLVLPVYFGWRRFRRAVAAA